MNAYPPTHKSTIPSDSSTQLGERPLEQTGLETPTGNLKEDLREELTTLGANQNAAPPAGSADEFSIDELRELARHFGVARRAQITDRSVLVREIRKCL